MMQSANKKFKIGMMILSRYIPMRYTGELPPTFGDCCCDIGGFKNEAEE